MINMILGRWRGIRNYVSRVIRMMRIHTMLDIEGVNFVDIKPISDTDYMVTVPSLSLNEMKANFNARSTRIKQVKENDWLSVIDKAEAEYNERVAGGFDFSAQIVGDVEFESAEFVKHVLERSYHLDADVHNIGDTGYGDETYIISFESA